MNGVAEGSLRHRRSGTAIEAAEARNAAMAVSRLHIVATRDPGFFQAAGLSVISPWPA